MENCKNCIYLIETNNYCLFKSQVIEGEPIQQGCSNMKFKPLE